MSAVHISRLMAGVIASLDTIAGVTSVWAPSEYPRPGGTPGLIAARLLDGPSTAVIGGESVREAELPTAARMAFDAGGGTVRLHASGFYWEAAGASATAVRDAMLAAIAAEPYIDATAAAFGTDAIDLADAALGGLHGLGVSGPASIAVQATERAVVQTGEVQSTVEVQAFSTQRYPNDGAADLLSTWLGGLWLPSHQRILERFGLVVLGPRPAVVDLTAQAGPSWESRAAIRLAIGQVALRAELLEPIERVVLNMEARPGPVLITAEAEL